MTTGIARLAFVGACVAAGFILAGVGLEAVAHAVAPEQQRNSCSLPERHHEFFKPNCVSAPMKMAESRWLTYAYNDCGYRTAEPCRTRQPGQRRVAVIGTSIAYGLWVPYPQTWTARVGATLTARCRRLTDVQNLGFPASHDGPTALWHDVVDSTPKALELEPDAIVAVIGPVDLGFYPATGEASPPSAPSSPAAKSPKQRLLDAKTAINASSSVSLFRHWWLSDPGRLAEVSTQSGDTNDFLRAPTPQAWRARLAIADDAFAKISAAARARNVPWIVVLAPTSGQAALAAQPPKPGFDPYLIGRELGELVRNRGGSFYDLTGDFARRPHLDRDFYIVNGHPTGEGEEVIASRVSALLAQHAPAFQDCAGAS